MPFLLQRLRRPLRDHRGPTRREVLERSLAVAAGLLAGCASSRRGGSSGPRVVVVGAGLAGLACAHELRERGAEVTVVEARARVGGRVHSLANVADGAVVEAGGEFVGANHPHWLGYARRFGLELLESTSEAGLATPVVLVGERLSEHQIDGLWREVDTLQERLTTFAREVDGDAPWAHAHARAIDARHVGGWVEEQPVSQLARHAFRVLLTADMGVPTARQSLLAMLAQVAGGGLEAYWTQSEAYRCRGGNARLAEALAQSVGSERILLGTALERVVWTERRATLETSAGRIEADRVVLAVPAGVVPRLGFEPALPHGAVPQMGASVKYLATVSGRYWRDAGLAPESLTDGSVTLTWEATAGQPSAQAVLTAFSSADAAASVRKSRGDALRALYAAEIDALLPGFADAFVSGRFLDWPAEAWTRGGYSFPAPGEVTTRVRALREPAGPVVFAGEHVSTRFPGYMEGALESGVRAADLALRSG